jgi:hypothetical protein
MTHQRRTQLPLVREPMLLNAYDLALCEARRTNTANNSLFRAVLFPLDKSV